MTIRTSCFTSTVLAAAALAAAANAGAAERLTVTVSNPLDIARPAETSVIPWATVNEALPRT